MKFFPGLRNIYVNRDLLLQIVKREIEIKHKGSRLGPIWSVISPLMLLGLYFFVFGLVFGGRFGVLKNENFVDFALALFLGLNIFGVISDAITNSPTLITNQPNFVKKVIFPLEILPIAKVISSIYFSLLSIIVAIFISVFTNTGLSIYICMFPLLLIPLFMIGTGISWALSSIGVFFRDISHTAIIISTGLMYSSAIVYSPSRLPKYLSSVLYYNPVLILVDQSRRVIFWKLPLELFPVLYLYFSSIVILISGYIIFKRLRPLFADVL